MAKVFEVVEVVEHGEVEVGFPKLEFFVMLVSPEVQESVYL